MKTLALFKLHKTLVPFTLYAARRPHIVELLKYAYSNDHTPDRVDAAGNQCLPLSLIDEVGKHRASQL
jgi:hypothetical protein